MRDTPDTGLLEQFARDQSEAAFAELVRRYIGLVYAAAFRQTGNSQQAEDITQAVFIILARKAKSLSPKTVLAGWLYQTAQWTAANFRRAELRRVQREQEVFMQSAINETESDALWHDLLPVLDEALTGLNVNDRNVIVLRFLQNRNLADVGMAMGIAERTAQKRVSRALEKLRKFLAKRGVYSTTNAIAGAISAHSVQVVPAALAKTVTVAALTQGATASVSTLTLVKGVLNIMAWTKAKTALVVGAGALLVTTGTASYAWYYHLAPNAWQHRFEADYGLRKGEVLRSISPPFTSARRAFYQTEMNPTQVKSIPEGPLYMVVQQDRQRQLALHSCVFGRAGDTSGRATLGGILSDGFGFKSYEIEIPDRLENLPVNGDWTIKEGITPDDLLKALESILWQRTGHHIHFKKETVDQEVVVVTGDHLSVPAGSLIQLYARDLHDRNPYGEYGDFESLLKDVGNRLKVRLVNQTTLDLQSTEAKNVNWTHHADYDGAFDSPHIKELTDDILKNLASQTGLAFGREELPETVWVVTDDTRP